MQQPVVRRSGLRIASLARGLACALVLASSALAGGVLQVIEEADLAPGDVAVADLVGWSVALSGDTLFVGAREDDVGPDADAGSATVFVRSGTTWTEQQKITEGIVQPGDELGSAVTVDGGWAALGAPKFGTDRGLVLIYQPLAGVWSLADYLGGTSDGDYFGAALALRGAACAVGMPQGSLFEAGGNGGGGRVRVLRRVGASWSPAQAVTSSDLAGGDLFGHAVAISPDGSTMVVGAPGHDAGGVVNAGAAYVFELVSAVWTQRAKLESPSPVVGEHFGFSVAVAGDRVVVGEPFRDAIAFDSGQVSVFRRNGTQWLPEQELVAGDGNGGDQLGWSVAISGDRILAGAQQASGGAGSDGAGYLFLRQSQGWVEQAKLVASDPTGVSDLGCAAALDGDAAALGAYTSLQDGYVGAGAVHAYRLTDPTFRFCDGSDGSLARCACDPGDEDTGCNNAQDTGGVRLEVTCLDLGAQTGVLTATSYPPAASPTAIVMRGNSIEPVPVVFFDGLRCVGLDGFARMAATAAAGGASTHAIAHGAGPGRFFYQVWYRNNPAEWCDAGAAANTSGGQAIEW